MSTFAQRYWASLTGYKFTPREDLNMSTPGMGARTMHGIEGDNAWDLPRYKSMVPQHHGLPRTYDNLVANVVAELGRASQHFPPMVSAHEGFAILKEEVDELWDTVRMKQSDPDRPHAMRVEALQVAAMALRFLHDVCGDA